MMGEYQRQRNNNDDVRIEAESKFCFLATLFFASLLLFLRQICHYELQFIFLLTGLLNVLTMIMTIVFKQFWK